MGRELKRVPLDFNWPIDQIWKGYINPYNSMKCKPCDGTGENPATKQIDDDFYSFNNRQRRWCDKITDDEVEYLVKAGRLSDFMPDGKWFRFNDELNVWQYLDRSKEINEWVTCEKPKMPTKEEVNAANVRGGMSSHDAVNRWILIKARAKRLGVYGICEYCQGEGEIWQSEEIKKLAADWEKFEPPVGEGYQLWNTTTEGHPMSPVFKSLELLCEHLEKAKASVFGYETATKEKWMQMLKDDNVHVQKGNIIFI